MHTTNQSLSLSPDPLGERGRLLQLGRELTPLDLDLLEAQDAADVDAAALAGRALEVRVREEAKRIKSKYVSAPHTTDFAVLFLPTEGLYAEVLRRPGLFESLQRDHRVMVAGPTTLMQIERAAGVAEPWLAGVAPMAVATASAVPTTTSARIPAASAPVPDAARRK